MKVCFAIQVNDGLESAVYDHFGSAPSFLIVDTEQEQIEILDNSNTHQEHGACNPAGLLGGRQIDAMVVGGIGAGAIMRLNAMNIKIFSAGALKVGENIDLLKGNKLREITPGEACGGHQGGQCGH